MTSVEFRTIMAISDETNGARLGSQVWITLLTETLGRYFDQVSASLLLGEYNRVMIAFNECKGRPN